VLAVETGTRDNVESCRTVFRRIKERGLNPKAVRIGIMDGLPGLDNINRTPKNGRDRPFMMRVS
jgi:hypothetical protein